MTISRTTLQEGRRVGEWTLLAYRPGHQEGGRRHKSAWKCQCSCGVIRHVQTANLASGSSKSCGCVSLHASKNRHAVKNERPVNSVFSLGSAA